MAIPVRSHTAGTFFITTATHDRRRVFQVTANAQLLINTLERYRKNFLLHAYAIMPDHIHLILTPGDISLERCMQLIKGGFSHALGSKLPVWQRGFTDHRLRDPQSAAHHCKYVAQNPIEARLVERAEDYLFSSAHADALRLDPLPEHLRG